MKDKLKRKFTIETIYEIDELRKTVASILKRLIKIPKEGVEK